MDILKVESLSKDFDGFRAVDRISFSVPRGCIYALLGPNGAGKSTTLRMILGILAPTTGDIMIDGESVTKNPTLAKMKMGYMPQYHSLFEDLTVYENLEFYAEMYLLNSPPALKDILEFVELWDVRNRLVGHLSGGMKQRASLACALVHNPSLLILDEPTAGVDPTVRRKMWDYFQKLKGEGRTVIITTHYMDEVTNAEYIHLIRDGKTLMVGTPEEIVSNMYDKETITLTLEDGPQARRFAREKLAGFDAQKKGKNKLVLTGDFPKEKSEGELNKLLEKLGKSRGAARVLDISKKKPSLEEAFVHYSQSGSGKAGKGGKNG